VRPASDFIETSSRPSAAELEVLRQLMGQPGVGYELADE
jgi:hypothetical protein